MRGGNLLAVVKDSLGSPRLIVDASTGVVAQALRYDECGVVISDSSPGFQPFGFVGGLWDGASRLLRFGHRDYDCTVGRWTSKDPIRFSGGLNLYEYCEGDPVNRTDPTGLAGLYSDAGGVCIDASSPPGCDFWCRAQETAGGLWGTVSGALGGRSEGSGYDESTANVAVGTRG
jgi:RHS repeat-associated protein